MAFVEVTKQGNVGIVTMNRPEALNALSSQVFADLTAALDVVEKDDDIYVVIITGAGRSFVAGADIGEMATMNVEEGLAFSELGNNLMMRVDLFSKPTIAAVNGFALGGGCELALAADIRVASEKAKFGQPEVGLGIIPGFGGTQRLPRLTNKKIAKELIFGADIMISADEAMRIGLVNHVYPQDQLMDEAKKLAKHFMLSSPYSIALAKQAINVGLDTDLDSGLKLEANLFGLSFATADKKEGMTCFLEKRMKERKFIGK